MSVAHQAADRKSRPPIDGTELAPGGGLHLDAPGEACKRAQRRVAAYGFGTDLDPELPGVCVTGVGDDAPHDDHPTVAAQRAEGSVTVQQLVEAALPARVRRWWSTVDVGTAVLDCADRLLPGAVTLPLTVFTGRLVYPVVVFPGDLVRRRLNGHREAIRDLDTLEQLIDAPAGDDPVSPLRIAGFISVDTPRAALPALSGLRTLGRAIHLRPFVDPDAVELRAYELRGITVAAAGAGATVAVPGHSTAAPGSRYDPFWRRVREEELWSLALAAGVLDEVVQR